jgi:hypothetical protein
VGGAWPAAAAEEGGKVLTHGPCGDLIYFKIFQTDSNLFKFDLIQTGPSRAQKN